MGKLADIRQYFRDRFEVLGFKEHDDGFDISNIGANVLDKSFHILLESVEGGPVSHTHQTTNSSVVVSVLFGSGRQIDEILDEAISSVDDIIVECCKLENRTNTGAGIFNVIFEGCSFSPQSEKNNNSVLVEINFTVTVLMGIEE
jgi:hypothetical protein